MIQNQKISLILPCRNEGAHLKRVLSTIPPEIDEVLLVSNRSTDGTIRTGKLLAEENDKIIFLIDDREDDGVGYGYAHQTGHRAASGDIIVAADSDGTYPIADLNAIVNHFIFHRLDFMSCDRTSKEYRRNIPFFVRIGVWVLNVEALVLHNVRLQDILSGMWVIKKTTYTRLKPSSGDWNFSPEIKLRAHTTATIKATEYPIKQSKRYGKTNQHYIKTAISHALWIMRYRS